MTVFASKIKSILVQNGKVLGIELASKFYMEKTSARADLLVFLPLQITAFTMLPLCQECCGSHCIVLRSFHCCAAPKQVEHL